MMEYVPVPENDRVSPLLDVSPENTTMVLVAVGVKLPDAAGLEFAQGVTVCTHATLALARGKSARSPSVANSFFMM
jgi:hypothetical protein